MGEGRVLGVSYTPLYIYCANASRS